MLTVEVSDLGGSTESGRLLDKKSYRVAITDDGKRVVVEARLSLGSLENMKDPKAFVKDWFGKGPLPPDHSVINIPWQPSG